MTTLLERRRIEADLAKRIYQVFGDELGAGRTRELLGEVARKAAFEAGQDLAGREGDPGGLLGFAGLTAIWEEGGALEIAWNERTDRRLSFDVTRCRYAEMYAELGVPELGEVLSCNRDGSLCTGYDSRIRMIRAETIMGGGKRCDFRFDLDPQASP